MGSFAVVYDTNVLVSALGFGGTPLRALLRGFENDATLVLSEPILDELSRVMTYERLPFTERDRTQYLSILRNAGEVIEPDTSVSVATDPDDDKFLESALAADAGFLVSGDDDLLNVGAFRGVEVVTPATFVSRVEAEWESAAPLR